MTSLVPGPFDLALRTRYTVECWRGDLLVWREVFHNLVTTVGKNAILNIGFRTGGGANPWFIGLVNNVGFTGYNAADTMASHAGWTEAVGYGETVRQNYAPDAASGGSIANNGTKATFTMNAAATIRGAFMVNDNTKSGAVGTLYGEGDFASGARSVISGDTLQIIATLNA